MEEANRLLERRLDEARSTVLEREAELENMASAHEERKELGSQGEEGGEDEEGGGEKDGRVEEYCR